MTVLTEVGPLKRVIVQPPGRALERMLPHHVHPSSPDYLLFDDLIAVPQAREEHARLQAVLGCAAEVLVFEDLLEEALAVPAARREAIDAVAALERLPESAVVTLESLSPGALAQTLIVGTVGGTLDGEELMSPLPNLIFTRDLAAVVGGMCIVGNARKAARRREAALTWALVDHHPCFAGMEVAQTSREVRGGGTGAYPLTVEGGDVLVISGSLVCIGASERTTWSMIVRLSEELLDHGFTRVLVVEMPRKRSSMHLDTVFTMLAWDRCVIYPPILERGSPAEVRVMRLRQQDGHTLVEPHSGSLLEALAVEGYPLAEVRCGGGHPVYTHREQWTDGANYVALSPGVVIGYARNTRTAEAMAEAGFRCVMARDFLTLFEQEFGGSAEQLQQSGERFAVHIAGSELSRGRGGPRCLTMPLHRA